MNGVVYLQMQSTITAIPNPDVFFVHVPKTAGTSLRSLLEQYHHQKFVVPTDILRRMAQEQGVPRSELKRTPELDAYACFHAHTNYVDFLREDMSRVTILRDPRSRLQSLMNHWQQWTDKEITNGPGKDHIKNIKRQAKASTLNEFLQIDADAVRRLFHNGMAKTLVSNFPVPEHVRLKGQDLLDRALQNLDRMDWVGITERFDESILLLCDYFAWPVPNATQRLNVRQHRTKETDEPTQSIKDALEYDQVIYARGVELLDTRLDELRARFEHLVTDQHDLAYCLSAENTKRWLAQTDSARPREINCTMDEPLRGIGWHEREGVDTGRTPSRRTSRWTGPGTESTIECLIKPADAYRVELGVESVIDQDIYRGVAISINGQESQAIDFDRSWVSWISGKPPRTLSTIVSGQPVGDDGFCRLKIQVPRTISQEQISPGCTDKRAKGIGICSYHIEVM